MKMFYNLEARFKLSVYKTIDPLVKIPFSLNDVLPNAYF